MKSIQEIKRHLVPGQCYRREDLKKYSNAIDRHLMQLQKDHILRKISGGLYYCPKVTVFGEVPPDPKDLIHAFLKDTRFLITSFNTYNSLGVGTTQLYNEICVYNHKRHGVFTLAGQQFHFIRKPQFPLKLSTEYILIDLIENSSKLSEDTECILSKARTKALTMDHLKLHKAIQHYASVRTKKFFTFLFDDREINNETHLFT